MFSYLPNLLYLELTYDMLNFSLTKEAEQNNKNQSSRVDLDFYNHDFCSECQIYNVKSKLNF